MVMQKQTVQLNELANNNACLYLCDRFTHQDAQAPSYTSALLPPPQSSRVCVILRAFRQKAWMVNYLRSKGVLCLAHTACVRNDNSTCPKHKRVCVSYLCKTSVCKDIMVSVMSRRFSRVTCYSFLRDTLRVNRLSTTANLGSMKCFLRLVAMFDFTSEHLEFNEATACTV